MLLRIWRTGVDPARWDEYGQFEREYSAPMFREQPGCLGVFFVRLSASEAAACTIWRIQADIDRLPTDRRYQATVARLEATGLLTGSQQVEVAPIVHSWLSVPDIVATAD